MLAFAIIAGMRRGVPRIQHLLSPAGLAAVIGVSGLLLAGEESWLALAVALLWGGSLSLKTSAPDREKPVIPNEDAPNDTMRKAVESISVPVLMFDSHRVTLANAAAREALGRHIVGQDARIALRHPEAVRLLEAEDGATVTIAGFTGGRSFWQLTRRRIDGAHSLIELTNRTAEADIDRSHTDFVANASHELRTPLASVIGYAETLIEDDDLDSAGRARFLGIIDREAKRMFSLIEDLMALSRIEAEKHERPTERVDLTELTQRVVAEFEASHGNARVVLAEGSLAPAMILGDRAQIEQVLRNLVDNALKYGGGDAPVRVAIVRLEDLVQLSVEDSGSGIAAEHLPHLTRRFYRTDPGRSRAAGGTGLGLAIVKHIVERHRATLDVASQLGKGTTVTIRFAGNDPIEP